MNAATAGERGSEPAATPPIVLIVEDEVIIRLAIAEYLRECGFTVFEAGSAEEAVTILNAGLQVDVVFTDVQLAGKMDGFGLALWVRSNFPGAEVIVASGVTKAAKKAGDLCAESERADISKPYDHREVERRIRLLLAARAAKGS